MIGLDNRITSRNGQIKMNLKAGYLNRLLQRLKIEMYRLRRKSDNY